MRRPFHATALAPAVAIAAGLAAAPAHAQDEPSAPVATPTERRASDAEHAIEVLVTATRREAPGFDVPFATAVIDDGVIRTVRLRRTLPDALSDTPGVMVQKTSYGQASPFIRGFTGYHTVLLVDGIRLNNSTFRSGPNQYWGTVDSWSVERVEVVRGVSSVLYGSDAVGGTVNAVSRRAHSFEPGLHVSGRAVARFSTAEHSHIYRGETEGNQDDLGFAAGVTYKGFGDLRAGHGTGLQDETGYRERDGDLHLAWREAQDAVWSFGAQRVEQDRVPRTHRTVHAIPFRGTDVGDELRRDLDQRRTLLYLRHARELDAPFANRAAVTLSWHEQRERQHRDRLGGKTDVQAYDVDTLGLQVQLEKASALGDVTYGVEYWRDDVTSSRKNYVDGVLDLVQVQGPVADDATYDLLGVYAQDEFDLCETRVTAGARFTYAAADADRVDDPRVAGADPATPGNVISVDDSWTDLSASLRAVHPLGEGWNVFAGASQGFRAPNLSDLTRLDDTSGVEVPSTDLDPERFLQGEIGAKAQHASWGGQVAVFATRIDDLIVPSPTGRRIGSTPEVRKDNVGDGYVAGVEVEGSLRPHESWTIAAGGTWQRGSVDQLEPDGTKVRRPLSRVMPLSGVLTVTYRETPKSPWWIWVSGQAADRQDRLSLKDETDTERIPPGGTPGWFVWSVGAGFEIGENATISAALENVGNVDYRIHGSGVNEPGRNFVLSLEVRF